MKTTPFSVLCSKNPNRSLQVLISDGPAMTDEVDEEETNDSEEESTLEWTLDERKEALKRSRWNVFMYLGFAALLFGFALYPFMSIPMEVEGGIGSDEETITVWGLPVAGEDFTDIPVEIEVIVHALPTDIQYIEIFMDESSGGCNVVDDSIERGREDLRQGVAEHPNSYYKIEDPVESQVYNVEFSVDPGIYCLQIVAFTESNEFVGNIESNVDIYPTQIPLAMFATMSLLMSAFAFIGAQKHGKYVKSLIEPKPEPSAEDVVLAETSEARIVSGPSGPPSAGPTGPPSAGPTGPPAAGPSGPPSEQSAPETEAVETTPEPSPESEAVDTTPEPVPEESTPEPEPSEQPASETAESSDEYEAQGDGWFFRKLPDGTYDQTVYTFHEGQYIPYVESDA